VFVFSKVVGSKRILEKHKTMVEKYNFQEVWISFGGPIVLNLKGNKGSLDVPVKLPRQQV
jgi:hypothetical protein